MSPGRWRGRGGGWGGELLRTGLPFDGWGGWVVVEVVEVVEPEWLLLRRVRRFAVKIEHWIGVGACG